jgi:hypothetical protein
VTWVEPRVGEFLACETTAADLVHLRRLVTRGVRLSGHTYPQPNSLCGALIAYDVMVPEDEADCPTCRELRSKTP